MGYKYEVIAWTRSDCNEPFKDVSVWKGDWFLMALLQAWCEKRRGIGCVSILWR